jgi:predicted nucleotidyltransferase component of viral defense system
VAESFFDLSQKDQREALEFGRAETDRPAHLLEKDVWVVWTLRALFESPLATDLTFKGGTSLSKVYKVIDRFSEDLGLSLTRRRPPRVAFCVRTQLKIQFVFNCCKY